MRIWTLHPRYLDARGLVALWRETLLAQHVLAGTTRGYRNHPQLHRFREQPDPLAAINAYLVEVHAEAVRRGYRFDAGKIGEPRTLGRMEETQGQLEYEWSHLRNKLAIRDPERLQALREVQLPDAHPLFGIRPGAVRDWEKV